MDNQGDYLEKQNEIWEKNNSEEARVFIDSITENSLSTDLRDRIQFFQNRYEYNVFLEAFVTNKYGAIILHSGKKLRREVFILVMLFTMKKVEKMD